MDRVSRIRVDHPRAIRRPTPQTRLQTVALAPTVPNGLRTWALLAIPSNQKLERPMKRSTSDGWLVRSLGNTPQNGLWGRGAGNPLHSRDSAFISHSRRRASARSYRNVPLFSMIEASQQSKSVCAGAASCPHLAQIGFAPELLRKPFKKTLLPSLIWLKIISSRRVAVPNFTCFRRRGLPNSALSQRRRCLTVEAFVEVRLSRVRCSDHIASLSLLLQRFLAIRRPARHRVSLV